MAVILHLHIPRTLGSTLHAHLARAVGKQFSVSGNSESEIIPHVERRDIKLVSGHFFWGIHKHFDDAVYFVVLRHPIDRVCSLYSYIVGNAAHPKHAEYRETPLHEILKHPDVRKTQISNGQVRQLVGPEIFGEPVHIWHFFRAVWNLYRGNVVVALSDRMERAIEELGRKVNVEISPSLNITNASNRLPVSRAEVKRIRVLNRWDTALFYWMRLLSTWRKTAPAVLVSALCISLNLSGCKPILEMELADRPLHVQTV